MSTPKEIVDRLVKDLVDKGRLIEGGWKSYELLVLPPDASDVQRSETRIAYYAGAQHLFGSILGMLEPDSEPTQTDLQRMDAIQKELDQFISEFKHSHGLPRGH